MRTNLTSRAQSIAVVGMLSAHAALLAYSASRQSPTWDEIPHLAAGLSHWQSGRFDLYRVNPPLIRMIAALPVLASQPRTNWERFSSDPARRAEFDVGIDFIKANPIDFHRYFTLARWACIPFSLLGGYLCWRWARRLYGAGSGLVALTLWCVCPNILAYGQLITPDMGATALGLASAYAFWRWLSRPTWTATLGTGLVLGLAELTKASWIILFGLWPSMLLGWWAASPRPRPSAAALLGSFGKLAVALGLGVLVLNLGFDFEGSFTRLGDYQFTSGTLRGRDVPLGSSGNRFADSPLAAVPVPLPKNYVLGIDVQKLDFERGLWSYLRGEWRQRGWLYYYLYVLLIKTPVGILAMALLAILSSTIRLPVERDALHDGSPAIGGDPDRSPPAPTFRDEAALLIPGLAMLAFVSLQTGFNHHIRYVLPSLPFLYIWFSRVAVFVAPLRGAGSLRCWLGPALVGLLVWSAVSCLSVYPHDLSYFNEIVGGPSNGHLHLANSNADWGQDLRLIRDWYDHHPEARPFHLAYDLPLVDPRLIGIDYRPIPPGPIMNRKGHPKTRNWPWGDPPTSPLTPAEADQESRWTSELGPLPGWYALSVNQIHFRDGRFEYFQEFDPVDIIGYSTFVYHISAKDANRVRARFSLPEVGEP